VSIRNLKALFQPRSVALIGASRKPHSVGKVLARNLFHSGFEGPIMPVHPQQEAVECVLAYPSVRDLPRVPDLGVIATPPDVVADVVRNLGEMGTRAAVIITAGFGEGGREDGQARRQAVLDAARPYTLRLVGPNCVGLMLPSLGLNASFAHISPLKGDLAFVTQSGAMVTAMLDWATPRGIGFSHIVSLGDKIDVDFGDTLDYLASDGRTRAILLYVEAITDARKFMSAARAAARTKPVIVIKGGRQAEGAKAVSSHTGALAGSDAVYDAAFRRAGMLRVYDLRELFDAAETLATSPPVTGERMAILTNGGGLGVLAVDALIGGGGKLAELSQDTLDKLNAVLPATWSGGNPVDIIGDAPGERYAKALKALLDEPEADAVLVLNCPVAVADSTDAAHAVIRTLGGRRHPVFTSWLGEGAAREARQLFSGRRIPSYETPEDAVRGFLHLMRYRRNQGELMETPPSIPNDFEPDPAAARKPVETALAAGNEWLSEADSKAVLAAYGLPIVETRTASNPEEAVQAAEGIGFPVALKILSPDITHKSEVGGVKLELEDADGVRAAAEAMLRRVARNRPDATVDGFTVQRMVRRAGAHELIIGATEDVLFGPVLLFGQGGTAVEVLRDQCLALPPLNMNLARRMIADTRVYRLLEGYRDQPRAALDEIAMALIKLSQLIIDLPEIAEVDINPLLADDKAVVALDARIKVRQPTAAGTRRLAIRPYPKQLEERTQTYDGLEVMLRPIRPEDEPALREAFKKLSPEDVRLRFFTPIRELSHQFAARLTQIDYNREMALVATTPDKPEDLLGVVRIAMDPDNRRGEYAVVVRSDLKGRGLGYLLMERIIAYARARGTAEVVGDVLAENRGMLEMCKELGFDQHHDPEDPQLVHVRLTLNKQAA
jgi:acetyltransferase